MAHTRVAADRLRNFSIAVFDDAGAPRDHAARATDVLIWASLRGVDKHGIRNLKRYYLEKKPDTQQFPFLRLAEMSTTDHGNC